MKKLLISIWIAGAALAAAQTNRPSVFPHGLIVTGDVTVAGGAITAESASVDVIFLASINGKNDRIDIDAPLFFDGMGSVFYLTATGLSMNQDSFADLGVVTAARLNVPTATISRLSITATASSPETGVDLDELFIRNWGIDHLSGRQIWLEDWSVTTDETMYRFSADRLDGLDSSDFLSVTGGAIYGAISIQDSISGGSGSLNMNGGVIGGLIRLEGDYAIDLEAWEVSPGSPTMGYLSADFLDGLDVTNFVLHTVIQPTSNTSAPAIPSAVHLFEDSEDLWIWSPYYARWRKIPLQEIEE